jgi:hypothetical protein
MMNIKHFIKSSFLPLAIGACMVSLPLQAADLSYSFAEFGYYIDHEVDDADGEGGFKFGGSYEVYDNIFVFGRYTMRDIEWGRADGDINILRIGGGYAYPVHENWDVYGTLALATLDVELGRYDEDDTGLALSGGVRGFAIPNLEVRGALNYESLDYGRIWDEDEIYLELGASYYIIPNLSAGLDITFGDNNWIIMGAKYHF